MWERMGALDARKPALLRDGSVVDWQEGDQRGAQSFRADLSPAEQAFSGAEASSSTQNTYNKFQTSLETNESKLCSLCYLRAPGCPGRPVGSASWARVSCFVLVARSSSSSDFADSLAAVLAPLLSTYSELLKFLLWPNRHH